MQSKKISALYTVSSAIRGYLEPSSIASRGVAALCEATGADAGLCFLYPPMRHEKLELVAHSGFSEQFPSRHEVQSTIAGLAAYVAKNGQSLFVADLETDSRASRAIVDEEHLRSVVIVPIATEDEILGAIGLFSRERARFDGGTVMLVSAAANQIGLAARQANLLALYQKQTKNLSALYRLSHELSRNVSADEVFQSAFTIIRDELGLKRLWLGLLNDMGTRIVGQAAFGPGWRRRLIEMNVELVGRDHPIARAVSARAPIVLENADEVLQEFGVRRIFSRLAIHSVILVPLMAGGQVLGVLAAQPGPNDPALQEEEITLLQSLASEVAVTILSTRLEDRIAEAEKMRTAGLLAAGIAHNFNNVLQAIMGQASLLEMQAPTEVRVKKSASIINEAAIRGAGLVKQLLSFAHLEEARKDVCNVNQLIERHHDTLHRLVRSNHELKISLSDNLPTALVDGGQVLRILSTMLSNAADAMPNGGVVEVSTDAFRVNQKSPHYDVSYGYYVRIVVRDHGLGMDEDTRRRCFEPFFTTKNVDQETGLSFSGAGLGLAAAYALARRNGGRITVESQVGYGSVFTLYVPVAEHAERDSRSDATKELAERIEIEPLRSSEESHGDVLAADVLAPHAPLPGVLPTAPLPVAIASPLPMGSLSDSFSEPLGASATFVSALNESEESAQPRRRGFRRLEDELLGDDLHGDDLHSDDLHSDDLHSDDLLGDEVLTRSELEGLGLTDEELDDETEDPDLDLPPLEQLRQGAETSASPDDDITARPVVTLESSGDSHPSPLLDDVIVKTHSSDAPEESSPLSEGAVNADGDPAPRNGNGNGTKGRKPSPSSSAQPTSK
ncbi:MAG: GAF domain-containing protein [Deltaproteobacteria bacterium]|nr:GAF domain-containing protein [Deltaproteobacteria bacterium]